MICSSVNRLGFMSIPFPGDGLYPFLAEFSGLSSRGIDVVSTVASSQLRGFRAAMCRWFRSGASTDTGPTVLEVLDRFSVAKPLADLALRIPAQAIYKFDDRRIIAGRVETGRVSVGEYWFPRACGARWRS
jgi:translation elongation factor EF-1alpha